MRRMRQLYFLLTVLIFLSFGLSKQAMGAEWKLYFENVERTKFYIDTKSIAYLPESKVRAWGKLENVKGGGTTSLLEINCLQRMYTYRAMEPIDKTDIKSLEAVEPVMRMWTKPHQKWEYIGTSDLDDVQYKTWCNQNRKQENR